MLLFKDDVCSSHKRGLFKVAVLWLYILQAVCRTSHAHIEMQHTHTYTHTGKPNTGAGEATKATRTGSRHSIWLLCTHSSHEAINRLILRCALTSWTYYSHCILVCLCCQVHWSVHSLWVNCHSLFSELRFSFSSAQHLFSLSRLLNPLIIAICSD